MAMATTMRARWWVSLVLALALLTLSLAACQVPGAGDSIRNTGAVVVSTAVGGSPAATPTLPPFTIGAWTSNTAPRARDSITIYIICMVQDPATGGASRPAVGLRVYVNLRSPINHSYSGTTGGDGVASVRVNFNDSHPGAPVAVDVATTWHGVTYRGRTFFTPAPQGKPSPTPEDGGATPSPGAAPPPPVASPTAAPDPTATPAQQPTETPLPAPTNTLSS